MKQLTREEAIAVHDGGKWRSWSHERIAHFQMEQDRMCVPFGVFHEAVEKALGRPVWTHEFGLNRDGLMRELKGEEAPPSMEDILNLIPEEKRIVLVYDATTEEGKS